MAPEQAAVISEPSAWQRRSQAASRSNIPASLWSIASSDSGTQTTSGAAQSDIGTSTRIGRPLQPVTWPGCAATMNGSSTDWPYCPFSTQGQSRPAHLNISYMP